MADAPQYFRSAVELLDLLRRNTVEIIEKLTWWRRAHQDEAKIFLWNGVNYLSKVGRGESSLFFFVACDFPRESGMLLLYIFLGMC